MCTEWIYKAEKDGVSFLAASFSDYAEVNISLENLMQVMLILLTQDVQSPGSVQHLVPFHFLALPNYLTHLSVSNVCMFLSPGVS